MLMPKRVKYRKKMRGKIKGRATRGHTRAAPRPRSRSSSCGSRSRTATSRAACGRCWIVRGRVELAPPAPATAPPPSPQIDPSPRPPAAAVPRVSDDVLTTYLGHLEALGEKVTSVNSTVRVDLASLLSLPGVLQTADDEQVILNRARPVVIRLAQL